MINKVKCLSVAMNTARTEPLLSSISIHLSCKTAINVCVQGPAKAAPKLVIIQEWSTDGIRQSFTMPSRTLATIWSRDIGKLSTDV